MDENEVVEVEEEIDMSGWDDDYEVAESTTEEEDETPPETEEEPEAEETETETKESETEEEAPEADQPEEKAKEEETKAEQEKPEPKAEAFTLKHLGEVKEYTRDETVALAQKGLDYDRIRTERDALKAEAPKHKDHEAFLEEVAKSAGVDVETLIEDIRTKALVDRESKAGRPLTETAAREQIQRERAARLKENEPAPEAAPAEPETQKDSRDEKKRAELQKFAMAHPDVKGTDIPQEVWQEYRESDSSFEDIYTRRVLYPRLQKELEDLKKQKSADEQNAKNAARSTGSRKSAGAGRAQDPAFAGWDD